MAAQGEWYQVVTCLMTGLAWMSSVQLTSGQQQKQHPYCKP